MSVIYCVGWRETRRKCGAWPDDARRRVRDSHSECDT